jgi:virulence factor Mce-like protein
MTNRRGAAALIASPVLVGAVTVLIAVIAVFIAYNANSGLPFVPTYDIRAELQSGGKLVRGNEVRMGGFRVGVVDEITTATREVAGERRAIAVVRMKLDKIVEPIARDTRMRVRPRSALGLKYVEVTPGRSKDSLVAGDTLPLKQSSEPLELEDVFKTFDDKSRPAARAATEGFGDAFAGRGQSLNRAIEALNPFFRSLTPVMRTLADPDTELDEFFRQLGGAAAQAAPVARVQAQLFTDMADTFEAVGREPRALQETIEKSPPTLDVATRSFAVQEPFLADFADLSARLRPAARELPQSLPPLNSALRVGTPVLRRSVGLNRRLTSATLQLEDLVDNPSTLLALRDLRTSLAVLRPAIEYIAPYQTVCNYTIYFLHPLGEHQSQVQGGATGGGTVQNQNLKLVNTQQPNNYGTVEGSRKWDILPGQRPQGAKDGLGNPLARFYAGIHDPAIDAQGNADCQIGQWGYPNGRYTPGGRYDPGVVPGTDIPTGGNGGINARDLPGLRGGTYKSRDLGIDNLRDVP